MEHKIVSLVGRLLLAHMFLLSGIDKISSYSDTQVYMETFGVTGILLPLVILLEIGGAIALIIGLFTRWVAYALAVFSILTAFIFHGFFDDQGQVINFMKNLTIAGGLMLLALYGPGPWSLEAKKRA